MTFEDYKTKKSVIVVYTGEGKGKTSASVGLMARALGSGWRVAFIQFIKHWEVGEHKFISDIKPIYEDKLLFFKGGKGFYNAGDLSAKNVSKQDHQKAAEETFGKALDCVCSGNYDLVICDEINNAVHDGLLRFKDIKLLIDRKDPTTSLCLTGRNFDARLLGKVDIVTKMKKIKHHFDDKYLANKGIDF